MKSVNIPKTQRRLTKLEQEELKKITTMLNTNPPPFIKKIIEKKAA